jgi:hypothetical protein
LGRLGSYRVLKELGAGGMGMVFLAEDLQLRRLVALKVMSPALAADETARKRFLREAQATAALHHDHVVTIYQVAEDRGVPFLAMEMLTGESLDSRLQREGRLPLAESLRIGREIASGLDAAHEQQLIHRDIKPANIWLESRKGQPSRVKILDFGLAHVERADQRLTQSGLVLGTPSYMSPEQAGGETVDHRSDLFSLGCVLYRMITGKLAFEGNNLRSIMKALMFEKPAPVLDLASDIPPAFSELIEHLLAKEPKDRPQSAAEVAEAITKIEAEPTAGRQTQPASLAPTTECRPMDVRTGWAPGQATVIGPGRSPRRRRSLLAGLLAVSFLVVAGLLLGPAVYRHFMAPPSGPDPDDGTIIPPVATEPFVVLAREGRPEKDFGSLADAVAAAQSGDAIEIRGDGPFSVPSIELKSKALTLRAGKSCRPLLSLAPEAVAADLPQLTTEAALTLEGLEFRREGTGKRGAGGLFHIGSLGGQPLALTHCRFVYRSLLAADAPFGDTTLINAFAGHYPPSQVQHCEFLGDWHCGLAGLTTGTVTNCLFLTRSHAVAVGANPQRPGTGVLHLRNNTMIASNHMVNIHIEVKDAPKPGTEPAARIDAQRNLGTGSSIAFQFWTSSKQTEAFVLRDHRAFARQLVALEDAGNHLGPGPHLAAFLIWPEGRNLGFIETLEQWKEFWKLDKVHSTQGQIQFQKADLSPGIPAPEKLTPQDFRLKTDDPKLKGFGADVDLVGPGPAYERWRQTPEYQQWRKDTIPTKTAPPVVEPFVVLARGGKAERKFGTLADAVTGAGSGDTIEVHADGPPITMPIKITGKALTIRAAPGAAPTLLLKRQTPKDPEVNLQTDSPLTLEGLAFHAIDPAPPENTYYSLLFTQRAPLRVANCRFLVDRPRAHCVLQARESPRCEVRNCQATLIRQDATFLNVQYPSSGQLVLDNTVIAGPREGHAVVLTPVGNAREATSQLRRNSIATTPILVSLHQQAPAPTLDKADRSMRVDVRENVFAANAVLAFGQDQINTGVEGEDLLKRLLGWREQPNAYAEGFFLFMAKRGVAIAPTKERRSVKAWGDFWEIGDNGSVQGPIQFQGGDIMKKAKESPAALVPADFRLADKSIGKGKRGDGKDLGADVDLVGPGPAYEKWKKTLAYQQWLNDANWTQAVAAVGKPFVVLGQSGEAERRFATFAEAMTGASAGDTIEIRGDGPFSVPNVKSNKALTIRAAAGCWPVLKFDGKQPPTAGFFIAQAPLVLEGLEFQRDSRGRDTGLVWLIQGNGTSLDVANCRFVSWSKEFSTTAVVSFGKRFTVRNCQFIQFPSGGAGTWVPPTGGRAILDNNLMCEGRAQRVGMDFHYREQGGVARRDMSVRFTRNTCNGIPFLFFLDLEPAPGAGADLPADRPFRLELTDNILDTPAAILHFDQCQAMYPPKKAKPLPAPEAKTLLARLLDWHEERNVFPAGKHRFVRAHAQEWLPLKEGKEPELVGKSLGDWHDFPLFKGIESLQGTIRYQGGDVRAKLTAKPASVMPADYRLLKDSVGYRAGKDKRDLGADVDLVGPGPAYERWKQTEAYKQWLRDTRPKP